jgi:hypothetical protein
MSFSEQSVGHTKIVETFRMLLGTFGGTTALKPKKIFKVFKTLYIRED